MIRSAVTLSISARDAQTTSYLVNGTHLGLLSASPQNTHVQTTHKPLQMIVAIKDDDLADASTLVRQRQMVTAWQSFLPIVARRSGEDLNGLMTQYRLFPDWLVLFDEHRLQAWLPAENGLFMLRDGELRRLRPTTPREMPPAALEAPAGPRQYYSLAIRQHDQFIILPPAIFSHFRPGEAAELLLGLRQLPAKVAELIASARLRGFGEEITWLSLQIVNLEEDQLPEGERRKPAIWQSWLSRSRRTAAQGETSPSSEAVSLAENDEQPVTAETPERMLWQLLANRRLLAAVAGFLILALIVSLIIVLAGRPSADPSATTAGSSPDTTASVTASPTSQPSATTAPTPTPDLPQLVVSARTLNLRSEPSREAELLAMLVNGDVLYQLGEPADEWVHVRTADGLEGYVFASYVSTPAPG